MRAPCSTGWVSRTNCSSFTTGSAERCGREQPLWRGGQGLVTGACHCLPRQTWTWCKSPYREGSWADEYLKDPKKSGRHNFGEKTDVDYGYQRIAGLMEAGGNYKNSDYLVQTLADDVIDFEKDEGSGIWTVRYGLEPGNSADPLDSLLGVMADDPQTATQFLDPKGNENLEYLMRPD